MKIETKFAPGDRLYILRPVNGDWLDSKELLSVEPVELESMRIDEDGVGSCTVLLDDEPVECQEDELYRSKKEAQEACLAQNQARRIFDEAVENGATNADPIEDLKNRVKRMEEKLDRFLKKEIDDGK